MTPEEIARLDETAERWARELRDPNRKVSGQINGISIKKIDPQLAAYWEEKARKAKVAEGHPSLRRPIAPLSSINNQSPYDYE